MGRALELLEEAGPDAGITSRRGDVDSVEVATGNLVRVPNRLLRGGVETLDVDDDLVRRLAAGEYGRAPARSRRPTVR